MPDYNADQTWYFTFGSDHAYPNGYIKHFGSYDDAREWMRDRFGDRWCAQYDESEGARIVDKWNMREVILWAEEADAAEVYADRELRRMRIEIENVPDYSNRGQEGSE